MPSRRHDAKNAKKGLTGEQIEEIRDVFKLIDEDGSGVGLHPVVPGLNRQLSKAVQCHGVRKCVSQRKGRKLNAMCGRIDVRPTSNPDLRHLIQK
eukprot:3939574-Rhodomonas_salina.1